MDENQNADKRQAAGFVGWAAYGLFLIGVASLLVALAALVDKEDFVGAGLCLIASAVSFGLLLNGMLRR